MNWWHQLREVALFSLVGAFLLITGFLRCSYAVSSKCETCKGLTRRFKEGLEKTAKSNFGGGNTHWEEKNLGSFVFSETRFLEVIENCCDYDSKECHYMLEENEDVLESWWFQFYAKGIDEDLKGFLCDKTLKVCCPDGTYGADCTECPNGKEDPCSGHGRCKGSGTREGSGLCSCDGGYDGYSCDECSTSRYFTEAKNDTHTICTACHFACLNSCRGADVTLCDDCKSGWSLIEGQGCIQCDSACNGCSGNGADECTECKEKYFRDGSTCKVCHPSCNSSCTDDTQNTCDSCSKGWQQTDEAGCQDIDECLDGSNNCKKNNFCLNSDGGFSCPRCDPSCDGCTGDTNKDCNQCRTGYDVTEEECIKCDISCDGCTGPTHQNCKECRSGYEKNEEGECIDIDECSNDAICDVGSEKCINAAGSYSCECLDGFFRRSGKCEAKRKAPPKKKKTKPKVPSNAEEEERARKPGLPEITPENFAEEVRKLGDPIEGIPKDDEMIEMTGNVNILPGFDANDASDSHTDAHPRDEDSSDKKTGNDETMQRHADL